MNVRAIRCGNRVWQSEFGDIIRAADHNGDDLPLHDEAELTQPVEHDECAGTLRVPEGYAYEYLREFFVCGFRDAAMTNTTIS